MNEIGLPTARTTRAPGAAALALRTVPQHTRRRGGDLMRQPAAVVTPAWCAARSEVVAAANQ
jgi:hypothetical protein